MKMTLRILTLALIAMSSPTVGFSEEKAEDRVVSMAEGKIVVVAPKEWQRRKPKTNIVEHEFAIVGEGENKTEGRFTVMAAGGGVEANISRWVGQFSQADGSSTKDKTKTEKLNVGGTEVHYVDISGDFKDQAGPFAPAVVRPNYRMLAAIIVAEKKGQQFLKFYGPKDLVTAHEKAFQEMVNSLKVK